jgi:hypothetical protein
MSNQIKVKFKLDRETKGAVRYQEINDAGEPENVFHKIGTLYLRKTAFGQGNTIPKELSVTVEG